MLRPRHPRFLVAGARFPHTTRGLIIQPACFIPHKATQTTPRLLSTSLTSASNSSQIASRDTSIVHEPRYAQLPSQPGPVPSAATDTVSPSAVTTKGNLPLTCPGCGALSQEVAVGEAGYYLRSRKAVKNFLRMQLQQDARNEVSGHMHLRSPVKSGRTDEAECLDEISEISGQLPVTVEHQLAIPVCDRCHDLVYNSKGQSIAHPSVQDIADSISESPYKKNHVYHVLDAADFPMSLFPRVFQSLELAKPRSQNRRSRHRFSTKPSVSFIITRSDLLAPAKEMVDRMLPYFQEVLRSALGKIGRDLRMGNVHLVSAKRGWWTTDIKNTIWERGGGNWMVGRVNVGKSNLFEVLFPKGSGDRAPIYTELQKQQKDAETISRPGFGDQETSDHQRMLSEDSLLPPPQPEVPFPTMPIVSNLPGTTASPIRLPFGNHRGELIDLPGLERGNLEQYVQADHKLDLVMQYRPNVKQHTIKAGQSLLLGGGLIRITPELDADDPSMTMLAYPFVPIDSHVTSTEKAVATQSQLRESGIKTILAEGAGSHMANAGSFGLSTDVTKARASPLIRAGVAVSKLPFTIWSTDILIEGVGWVELVCQVHKKRNTTSASTPESSQTTSELVGEERSDRPQPDQHPQQTPDESFKPFVTEPIIETKANVAAGQAAGVPRVQIFSPHGKHIAQRKPLGAWVLWDEGQKRQARSSPSRSSSSTRPRKPMAGSKKRAKAIARTAAVN